ncbi:uncharacterized protein BDR25DRAFT_357182 [Lindgomyces ingoldianus]|uniref:Uncharacterized protein n=1 Tax=Lindgomyces ingoldianus TaxID=673940 RepID=A0ACB6QQH4_9PLEO|nr:uncharacterized protein BDR25DRAFT_357182 [Lindgomyces ingoldianus]KAF2468818.1 hypothetical protein BDR25DRAFT_357182 [Lindgomyces ingoldianus]
MLGKIRIERNQGLMQLQSLRQTECIMMRRGLVDKHLILRRSNAGPGKGVDLGVRNRQKYGPLSPSFFLTRYNTSSGRVEKLHCISSITKPHHYPEPDTMTHGKESSWEYARGDFVEGHYEINCLVTVYRDVVDGCSSSAEAQFISFILEIIKALLAFVCLSSLEAACCLRSAANLTGKYVLPDPDRYWYTRIQRFREFRKWGCATVHCFGYWLAITRAKLVLWTMARWIGAILVEADALKHSIKVKTKEHAVSSLMHFRLSFLELLLMCLEANFVEDAIVVTISKKLRWSCTKAGGKRDCNHRLVIVGLSLQRFCALFACWVIMESIVKYEPYEIWSATITPTSPSFKCNAIPGIQIPGMEMLEKTLARGCGPAPDTVIRASDGGVEYLDRPCWLLMTVFSRPSCLEPQVTRHEERRLRVTRPDTGSGRRLVNGRLGGVGGRAEDEPFVVWEPVKLANEQAFPPAQPYGFSVPRHQYVYNSDGFIFERGYFERANANICGRCLA